MVYDTSFYGSFELDRPLTREHRRYLQMFSETRRMKRDAGRAAEFPDPVREAVGLPIGIQGGYFVGGGGFAGQDNDVSIVDYNEPPAGQPGLWCKWEPNDDGTEIEWNGVEKFSDYIEWITYLIGHFLDHWGYKLNGEVEWEGEERDDLGKIIITDNVVEIKRGVITYVSE